MINGMIKGVIHRNVVGLALVVCVTSACASLTKQADQAPHPRTVQPERPTVATHAGTVAAGFSELEIGIERDRFDDRSMATQVPAILKIGLAPRVQGFVSVPMASASGVDYGVGDASLGVKWRVLEDHPFWSDVAIQPSIKFSTGGDRGTGTTDASLLLIDSHMFGDVALDINVGVTRRGGDGSSAPKTATLWTVSSGFPVRGPVGFVVEVFGYPGTGGAAGSAPTVALLTGPTFSVSPSLTLDAGVIAPIRGSQPRAAYVGLVTNLGRFLPK